MRCVRDSAGKVYYLFLVNVIVIGRYVHKQYADVVSLYNSTLLHMFVYALYMPHTTPFHNVQGNTCSDKPNKNKRINTCRSN